MKRFELQSRFLAGKSIFLQQNLKSQVTTDPLWIEFPHRTNPSSRKQDFVGPTWERIEQHHCPVLDTTAPPNPGKFFLSPAKQSKQFGAEAGFVPEGWQVSGTGSTLSPPDASAGVAPALTSPSHGEDSEAGGCQQQGAEPRGATAGFVLPAPGATGFSLRPWESPLPPREQEDGGSSLLRFQEGWALPRDAPGDPAVPCRAVPVVLLLGGV